MRRRVSVADDEIEEPDDRSRRRGVRGMKKLRGWSSEQRKAMSEIQKCIWIKRKQGKRTAQICIYRAAYLLAETQLESFDKLPHRLRVERFMGDVHNILKPEQTT